MLQSVARSTVMGMTNQISIRSPVRPDPIPDDGRAMETRFITADV